MTEITINDKDRIIMKLLHYLITEESYSPVILHGAKDEIWLENMAADYPIVRIVSSYIHNEEQYEYDMFRAARILKSIKKKIFAFKVPTLSIFIDVNERVDVYNVGTIESIKINTEKDLKVSNILNEVFPNMKNKLQFNEKGIELFNKITSEINEKSALDAKKTEDIFAPKKPVITKIIILINTLVMALTIAYGDIVLLDFGLIPQYVLDGEYYRIITAMFLHGGLFHFFFNNYAIYILGSQIEGFFGKWKFLAIYLISGIGASLLSLLFLQPNHVSVGASGAIFGILGALLYFGYHYRVYLSNVLRSQIIPLIVLNLALGFMIPEIDNAAHIGGLLAGVFITMALGVKHKEDKVNQINGAIISVLFMLFLIYMIFIR